jgi:hypothetical protein
VPLRFAKQSTPYIIGSSDSAATLTAAYSGNQISFPTPEFDRAILYVEYTPAQSARQMFIQVEGAPTSTDFFPKTALLDDQTGQSTLLDHIGVLDGTTGSTTYKKRWEVPISDKFLRISAKEDGSSGFGTVKVQIILRYLR